MGAWKGLGLEVTEVEEVEGVDNEAKGLVEEMKRLFRRRRGD